MTIKFSSIVLGLCAIYCGIAFGDDAKKSTSDTKQAAQAIPRIRLLTKETSLGVLPLMGDYEHNAVSPDQAHIVYPVMTNGAWRLFKNGAVTAAAKAYARIAFPKFSPDGMRLAYHARLAGGRWTTVVDEQESPAYDMPLAICPIFSPDSKHVAFFINRAGSQILVVDGKEEHVSKDAYLENGKPSGKGAIDDRSLTFSPDGRHLAYVVVVPGRQWVVLDGVQQQKYDVILAPGPCFSPDSRHWAYGARLGSNTCAIVSDGKEVRRLSAPGLADLVFNSDGSTLAYVEALEGSGFRMVVGNKQQKRYPKGVPGSFRFSPDGQRFMYVAATESLQQLLVVDGKEYGPCTGVAPNSWCFSPDSKHFAYGAALGTVTSAVVDGQEFGRFDYIAGSAFSPDSAYCAFVAVRNGKAYAVVDRTESQGFAVIKFPDSDRVYGNYRPVFDTARRFHFQAAREANLGDIELTRIDVEIAPE